MSATPAAEHCSFCGSAIMLVGATELEWSQFPDLERGCQPDHVARLIVTRTIGHVVRRTPLAATAGDTQGRRAA